MSALLALDVALLLPPDVGRHAERLSASLPEGESKGLRLTGDCLPHVTLTQQFVRADELDAALACIDRAVRVQAPLALVVTGGGRGAHAVWMAIRRTGPLVRLHERLMDALHGYEQSGGDAGAFVEGKARAEDVAWVAGYRLNAAIEAYTPHVTLGHARQAPRIEPFSFAATTVAACHLGRFCSCRRVLRAWELR